MNTMLSLSDDEIEAVIDLWAGRIGQDDEAASDMAVKRIEQLERAKQSGHALHNFAMQEAA